MFNSPSTTDEELVSSYGSISVLLFEEYSVVVNQELLLTSGSSGA